MHLPALVLKGGTHSSKNCQRDNGLKKALLLLAVIQPK